MCQTLLICLNGWFVCLASKYDVKAIKLLQCLLQGDHLPGKPGKVREFQTGQGKVREIEKSGEVKSGVFFQALNTPKLVFLPGHRPGPRWGSLWRSLRPPSWLERGTPHPLPQLLQPQLLNNWLSGLTLFFINMKQRLLTISVNTRYRVIFACLYWKSQGISCGLESGHPVANLRAWKHVIM